MKKIKRLLSLMTFGILLIALLITGLKKPTIRINSAVDCTSIPNVQFGVINYDDEDLEPGDTPSWYIAIYGENLGDSMFSIRFPAPSKDFPIAKDELVDVTDRVTSSAYTYYYDLVNYEGRDFDFDDGEKIQMKWNGTSYDELSYLLLTGVHEGVTFSAEYIACTHQNINSIHKCLKCGRILNAEHTGYDESWINPKIDPANHNANFSYKIDGTKLYIEGVGAITEELLNEDKTNPDTYLDISNITDIYFGKDITKVEGGFFADDEHGYGALKNVYFSSDVTFIGESLFAFFNAEAGRNYVPNLEKIVIESVNPPQTLERGKPTMFSLFLPEEQCPENLKIVVPAQSIDSYKNDKYWHDFEEQYIEVWGVYKDRYVPGHTHTPNLATKVPGVASTCNSHGSVEYYTCGGKNNDGSDCTCKITFEGIEITDSDLCLPFNVHNHEDNEHEICNVCQKENLTFGLNRANAEIDEFMTSIPNPNETIQNFVNDAKESLTIATTLTEMQSIVDGFKQNVNNAFLDQMKVSAVEQLEFAAGIKSERTKDVQDKVTEILDNINTSSSINDLNSTLNNGISEIKQLIMGPKINSAIEEIKTAAGDESTRSATLNKAVNDSIDLINLANSEDAINSIKKSSLNLINTIKAEETKQTTEITNGKESATEMFDLAAGDLTNASDELKQAVLNAKNAIALASTNEEILEALNNGLNNIKSILNQETVKEEKTQELTNFKSHAKEQISSLVPDIDNASEEVKALVESTYASIEAKETELEVSQTLLEGLNAIKAKLANNNNNNENPKSKGVSVGATVGIAVGCSALSAISMFAVGWFVIAKKSFKDLSLAISSFFTNIFSKIKNLFAKIFKKKAE